MKLREYHAVPKFYHSHHTRASRGSLPPVNRDADDRGDICEKFYPEDTSSHSHFTLYETYVDTLPSLLFFFVHSVVS